MQWQHGLDRPPADRRIPYVPGNFVPPQNKSHRPADVVLRAFTGIPELEQE